MEQDFGDNIIVTINVFNSCNCFVPVSGQLFVANVKMIASRLDEVKHRAPNVSKTRLFIVEQFYFPVWINFFLSLGAMVLYSVCTLSWLQGPGALLSKGPVTFRVRRQILKSKPS